MSLCIHVAAGKPCASPELVVKDITATTAHIMATPIGKLELNGGTFQSFRMILRLRRDSNGQPTNSAMTKTSDNGMFELDQLSPYSMYEASLVVITNLGESPASSITFVTLEVRFIFPGVPDSVGLAHSCTRTIGQSRCPVPADHVC